MILQKVRLRTRFLLSSFLVLIPVVLFSIIIYQYNTDYDRNAADTSMASSLSRAAQNIDVLLTHIDNMVTNLFDPFSYYEQTENGYSLNTNLLVSELNYLKTGLYYEAEPVCFLTEAAACIRSMAQWPIRILKRRK